MTKSQQLFKGINKGELVLVSQRYRSYFGIFAGFTKHGRAVVNVLYNSYNTKDGVKITRIWNDAVRIGPSTTVCKVSNDFINQLENSLK